MSDQIQVRALSGFNDPWIAAGGWKRLVALSETCSVFQSEVFQRIWWKCFGRGRLHLLLAERQGEPLALAALFVDGGMAFPVGSGSADSLDLIGDLSEPAVLQALLRALLEREPELLGLRFYLLPDTSANWQRLQQGAASLGMLCCDEGDLAAPVLDFDADPAGPGAAAERRSLRRHERGFARDGDLRVDHLRDPVAIEAQLESFFEQHIARWNGTASPSLFLDPLQRRFYRELVRADACGGSLRFTQVLAGGRLIAAHFGFCHGGVFLWYKPSFDPALARRSPGEVLLRQLLLAARAEGAGRFDFGIGDEAFKLRFATAVPRMRTWGLYPCSSVT
ncbi:GNAT family N-acetyltransferase [Synechococcus sp. 1G10]|uniref:GNAT family N-acetyltransferase n=1 Tax=Synechococcus sp. 1G10 TaxID=2025605 RepID=UPI000B9954BE|nr:GNAT family N-acetyltransferase [Synechococcus sp. 1G10]